MTPVHVVAGKNIKSAMGSKNYLKYVFISGIPASGKSYLAKKIAIKIGAKHVCVDDWREEMRNNFELKKWVDFFFNQDEKKYWNTTSCNEQWGNLKKQSEAFWSTIKSKIEEIQKLNSFVIFEGVNILPHLAKDLNFGGIVLLGESFDVILERNKKDPRWGKTEDLQICEARAFWDCERVWYKKEAQKYGFKTYSDTALAEKEILKIFQIS